MFVTNGHCDCLVEDILDTVHLFATAFHVHCAHLICHSLSLFGCYWRQPLCAKKLNAVSLVAKVGFESEKDDGSSRAEMENFGIPL